MTAIQPNQLATSQSQHHPHQPYDHHTPRSPSVTSPHITQTVQPNVVDGGSMQPTGLPANTNNTNIYPGQISSYQQSPSQPPIPQPLPLPPPQLLLPAGAVPMNGGVLFHTNVFSNSYRVPGPNGSDYIYYDNSVPLPPVRSYPTLMEQWHSLTRLLKVFIVLLVIFWFLQLTSSNWPIGLCMPIIFLPTYLLYRQWQKHYQSVELYMLVKLYAIGFAPGSLIVMVIESVLTILFMLICFQSYIATLLEQLRQSGTTPTDPTEPSKDPQVPPGMEFLNFPESPALIIFLFLLSYGSAGGVEESLKYYCTNRIKNYRPSYKVLYGYTLYALASALGFSTVENIGYVISGAVGPGGDPSLGAVFLNTLGRVFISTPLHLLTGYLIGLQVIRRDILGESLSLVRVMGWSVFFHGSFDFGLFLIMALQKHWSTGPDDNLVSYILMACVIINCYAGLLYKIWRFRSIVFPVGSSDHDGGGMVVSVGQRGPNNEIYHAVDIEAPPELVPTNPNMNGFAQQIDSRVI